MTTNRQNGNRIVESLIVEEEKILLYHPFIQSQCNWCVKTVSLTKRIHAFESFYIFLCIAVTTTKRLTKNIFLKVSLHKYFTITAVHKSETLLIVSSHINIAFHFRIGLKTAQKTPHSEAPSLYEDMNDSLWHYIVVRKYCWMISACHMFNFIANLSLNLRFINQSLHFIKVPTTLSWYHNNMSMCICYM